MAKSKLSRSYSGIVIERVAKESANVALHERPALPHLEIRAVIPPGAVKVIAANFLFFTVFFTHVDGDVVQLLFHGQQGTHARAIAGRG